MDWIKCWHRVKFTVLAFEEVREVGAWVQINSNSHASLSLHTRDYIRIKITVNQFCSQCKEPVNYNHRFRFY